MGEYTEEIITPVAKLFNLKRPEDIGMQLTEGLLMESKVCVSAMVFAHPDARCFLQRN